MDKCPRCGYVEDECELEGCHEPAIYEGWWDAIGPFGIKTGLMQRRRVCDEHASMLRGYDSELALNKRGTA